MEQLQVIGCVLCSKVASPSHGTKVTLCEKCKKAVWVGQAQIKLKQSKNIPIWCDNCIAAIVSDDVVVVPIDEENLDKIDDIVEKLKNEDAGTYLGEKVFKHLGEKVLKDEKLAELLRKTQTSLITRLQAGHDQFSNSTERILPTLLKTLIPYLKMEERLEDLLLGTLVSNLVVGILLKRSETLGSDKMFDGYSPEDSLIVVAFLMGVSKAVERVKTKGPDQLKHATNKELSEGWKKWWVDFFEDTDTGEETKGFDGVV
jgi:hypothetical protein